MNQLKLIEKLKLVPIAYLHQVEDFIDHLLEIQSSKKSHPKSKRKLGLLKGKISISKDFCAPLNDFEDYM